MVLSISGYSSYHSQPLIYPRPSASLPGMWMAMSVSHHCVPAGSFDSLVKTQACLEDNLDKCHEEMGNACNKTDLQLKQVEGDITVMTKTIVSTTSTT